MRNKNIHTFIGCDNEYNESKIAIFGAPFDSTTSFRPGTRFASKKYNPVENLKADEWNKFGIETRYYNTELHKGAFALPNYVKDLIK